MKVNKVWAIFTILLVLVCITLASHMSYRKAARHFRDKKLVGLGGSWVKPLNPMAPLPAPGSTVFETPLEPMSTATADTRVEVIVARYEMFGMISSGFFGLLGIAAPFVLPKWLRKKKEA